MIYSSKRFFVLAMLGLLLGAKFAMAENSRVISNVAVVTGPDYIAQIESSADVIRSGTTVDDFKSINDAASKIQVVQAESGIGDLEDLSGELLSVAAKRLYQGSQDKGYFYVRRALDLSPGSAIIRIKALPLLRASGSLSLKSEFSDIVDRLLKSPLALVKAGEVGALPILMGLTLGMLLTLILLLGGRLRELGGRFAQQTPRKFGLLFIPSLSALLLSFVLLLGPLWAIVIWTLIIFISLPRLRSIGVLSGLTLILWGIVLPIRHTAWYWMAQEPVMKTLRVAYGDISSVSSETIAEAEKLHPNEPILRYAHGMFLRWRGSYADSTEVFQKLRDSAEWRGRAEAELGTNAALMGKPDEANRQYTLAESDGYKPVSLLFNFSRVKFDLVDTAGGKSYFTRASEANRAEVDALEARENSPGVSSAKLIVWSPPGFGAIWRSLSEKAEPAEARTIGDLKTLMPKSTPLMLNVIGAVLIVIGVLPYRRRRLGRLDTPGGFGTVLRLIPGGSWALSEMPIRSWLIITTFSLLLLPIVGWPSEVATLVGLIPGALRYYVSIFCLVAFLIAYWGLSMSKGEE